MRSGGGGGRLDRPPVGGANARSTFCGLRHQRTISDEFDRQGRFRSDLLFSHQYAGGEHAAVPLSEPPISPDIARQTDGEERSGGRNVQLQSIDA